LATIKTINLRKILKAAVYIFAPLLLGFILNGLIDNSAEFYNSLIKPPLAPQAIVFPIAWSVLYILMGIASYIARDSGAGMKVYVLQLIVNLIYSFLFFRFQLIGVSALWIAFLFVLVLINTILFWRYKKIAGILLIPYLLWLLFAFYLNFAIYLLN